MRGVAGVAVAAALAAGSFLIPKPANRSKKLLVSIPHKPVAILPVEKSIEVRVPAITAYKQWTNFSSLSSFLSGVHAVTQVDDNRLIWQTDIDRRKCEWESEITQLSTGEKIAWRSVDGIGGAGVVTFCPISNATTWITVQMEYPAEDHFMSVGEAIKFNSARLQSDLKKFKEFIETQFSQPSVRSTHVH